MMPDDWHYINKTDLTWLERFVKSGDLCWELWQFLTFDLVSEAVPVVWGIAAVSVQGTSKLLHPSVWTSKHDQISNNIITFYAQMLLAIHYAVYHLN